MKEKEDPGEARGYRSRKGAPGGVFRNVFTAVVRKILFSLL
jgi:hypothetical protein